MSKEMSIVQVMVSPEFARDVLERSFASGFTNRPLSKKTVKKYAEAMKKGGWVLNNDAICIDDSGALINGQHRLEAVIVSGCTVPMFLAYHCING